METLKVREIFDYMEIAAVRLTPEYVKCVIYFRGKNIPVINLR